MRPTLLVACAATLATTLLGVPASAAQAAATAPARPGGFTGYAFDACETPSQAEMNTWRTRSPFAAVGVYLAGVDAHWDRSRANPIARSCRLENLAS